MLPTGIAAPILLAAIFLAGCLPVPHRANLTPLVHGEIRSEGVPAAEVRLRVALGDEDDACGGKYLEFATNGRGEFAVPPMRSFHLFLFPMAHRRFYWNLCVNAPEGWANVHGSSGYTLTDTGPWWFSKVTCDAATGGLLSLQCTEERDIDPSRDKARAILGEMP